MKKIIKSLVLSIAVFTFASFKMLDTKLPDGWFKAGSNPNGYAMIIDNTSFKTGTSAAKISSLDKRTRGFGTLMQNASAKEYLGKNIRISGYVKTDDIKKWSGLWARVDDAYGKVLSFDNMRDRKIKGTTSWTQYHIDMKVPLDAKSLNFGALVVGNGTLWFDGLSIEVLSDIKYGPRNDKNLSAPKNLDFDK